MNAECPCAICGWRWMQSDHRSLKHRLRIVECRMEVLKMKCVILAAGEGQRMRPLTNTMPKVMIPIAGKPILEYALHACIKCGIRDFVFVIGYGREKVQNYFQNGRDWNGRIDYAVEEQQLGTGHALKQARKALAGEKKFLVINGDGLIDPAAIKELLSGNPPAMLVKHVDPAKEPLSKYGIVRIDGGRVAELVERPDVSEPGTVNGGAYLLTNEIFDIMDKHPGKGNNRMTDLVLHMLAEGKEISAVPTSALCRKAIYPWDLLSLNSIASQKMSGGNEGRIEGNVHIDGKVRIGKGTVIHPNTSIFGPASIGEGCEIGPNAVIFPTTSIGNNVVIAPFCEIVESVIMDNVRISTGSIIHSSIIGSGVLAGLRLTANKGESDISVAGEWHHVKSLGAIIGEDTRIGDNVAIKPGSIIGAGCRIDRDKFVRSVPDGTVVM